MIVEAKTCAKMREQFGDGKSIAEIADGMTVSETTVGYHVRGECSHDISVTPVDPATVQQLPERECRQMRDLASKGASARDVVEQTGRSWSAVVAHLTGECNHDHGPTFDRESIYERILVSPEECAKLRREYDPDQEIRSLAKDVPWEYHTVLRHLNGQCDHDIDVEARETEDRAHVSQELCEQLRRTYRDNPDYTIDSLAEQYEVTTPTAESHIKFECSHPPSERIETLIETAGLDSYRNAESEYDEPSDPSTAASTTGTPTEQESRSTGQASGETFATSPTEVDAESIPTPRLTIVGDLEQITRENAEEYLADLGWRVGETTDPDDQFVVAGNEASIGGESVENIDTPVIDEATFLEYFGLNDDGEHTASSSGPQTSTIEADGSGSGPDPESDSRRLAPSENQAGDRREPTGQSQEETDITSTTSDARTGVNEGDAEDRTVSESPARRPDIPEDADTFQVSPVAAAVVRDSVSDPESEATDESELLSSVVREQLKRTVDDPDPSVTEVPDSTVTVAVDLESHHEALLEGLCGEDGVYEAPSAFVEDAIRSELDVPSGKPTDVTIPAETVAKIEAVVGPADGERSLEEFVLEAVDRIIEERVGQVHRSNAS